MTKETFLETIGKLPVNEVFNELTEGFRDISEEIVNLVLVQKNIYNRLIRDYKYGILDETELHSETETVKQNLKGIADKIEEASLNPVISQNLKFKSDKKPTIFISYSWHDKSFIDEIDARFSDLGFTLIRDIRDVKYTQNLKLFMGQVRDTDFVLMLISENYLKSANCMYEVIEVMKERDYVKRILPIVTSFKILSFQQRKLLVEYWNAKVIELKNALEGIEPDNAIGLYEELRKTKVIYTQIDEFTNTLSDMLCVTYGDLQNNNYKELFDRLGIVEVEIAGKLQMQRQARVYYKRASLSSSHEEKVSRLSKAIELDSEYKEAYISRADVFYELRMYENAISDLSKAISLDMDNQGLYNERGVNYRMNKQYKESLQDFDKAIQLQPKYEEAYSNRGLLWDDLGEYDKAINDFNTAILINKKLKFAYNNLGFTLRKLKRYDEAIFYVNKALELDSSYGFAYANLAEIYAAIGDKEKFLLNVEKALTNDCPISDYINDRVYEPYLNDPAFLKLLRTHKHPFHIQTRY